MLRSCEKSISRKKNGSSIEKFPSLLYYTGILKRLQHLIIQFPIYLTIRLWARDFYRVIVDEGAARVNYREIEIESE